ncbi:DUF2309 domain-containing protein [Stieleria sp. JC731]|uniref:DUF2309 domain-containing protein n=1 Tax=Pirellulaceae TaxID=2691357 RepID=UPI001E57A212|nr:DUF2309 domain-containing protein [Stieleria sp. JC731]MCC9603260.1 DUF2309 domain-containing protein [Stieleria sp. JC731]
MLTTDADPECSDQSSPPNLREIVKAAAHYLPSQGPITVFVHHNTLHAFDNDDFEKAILKGGAMFDCQPYLSEKDYRGKLASGRIRIEDLDAALQEDLAEEADRLVATFGTRYALRLAMLQHPLHCGTTHELRWIVAETDALRRFRPEVETEIRQQLLKTTRQYVSSLRVSPQSTEPNELLNRTLERFDRSDPQTWDERRWENFTLNYLWRVCCEGVRQTEESRSSESDSVLDAKTERGDSKRRKQDGWKRHRDWLLDASGDDADDLVNEILIPFCAAYLDQGFSDWTIPNRDLGFFQAFLQLHTQPVIGVTSNFRLLRQQSRRVINLGMSEQDLIRESLDYFGVNAEHTEEFILQSLLALRGWAGMIWQMETNADWAPHPAKADSLLGFIAIRLLLDRLAFEQVSSSTLGFEGTPQEFVQQYRDCSEMREHERSEKNEFERRAFIIFQLAQVRGWAPRDLQSLTHQQWAMLLDEINAFDSIERRRIYHRAFERQYRNAALDAVIAHNQRLQTRSKHESGDCVCHYQADSNAVLSPKEESCEKQRDSASQSESRPKLQVVCCIDDREESFRRHLEEIEPECETYGIAGFYGTAMYFRGAGDAHFKPLCPNSIIPTHYVIEEPTYSMLEVGRRRSLARRRIGRLTYQTHLSTRSFLGGIATAVVGSFAAFPLVGRVLFPRTASKIHATIDQIVEPPSTQLRIEKVANGVDDFGFTIGEMADIVEGALRASGLSRNFSPLVLILGHGSKSLNNPHESAYNCGACAGSQGGPNARAFAVMANDHRVRKMLSQRGMEIPDSTVFVGGYHDTTNESVTFADLDRLPITHRTKFEEAAELINQARQRNAHERCRRFMSAPLDLPAAEALRHVEDRPEDLSQARPEYNHATNALCFVGRRQWSRGLFLDRRAFLTSYDPRNDNAEGSILEGLLRAAIPVCAGISLEYYFSTVDTEGYGCGSKLPHNITSLLGVMVGSASDLRPGLSEQMVEIHEPMRILFVIETTREVMKRIIKDNEGISRLVNGNWVQLAVFDPDQGRMYRYVRGEFVLYAPHDREISAVTSSHDWYRNQREHLGFASIIPTRSNSPAQSSTGEDVLC